MYNAAYGKYIQGTTQRMSSSFSGIPNSGVDTETADCLSNRTPVSRSLQEHFHRINQFDSAATDTAALSNDGRVMPQKLQDQEETVRQMTYNPVKPNRSS